MKILAFADLHMGAGAAYADDRLLDQMKVLEQIATLVFERDIELVLIAGDVFHRPRPTPATLLAFRRFTDALATMEVPTIAITGNAGHDIEAGDRPCALDLFESRWFRVSRRPELIWDSVSRVNVATLPSVPVSRLVSQSESIERAPIFDQAAEALLAIAEELHPDEADPAFSILLGHWTISGASLPNGLPVDSLNEPILDAHSLASLGYDAMIFGHIHEHQSFGFAGWYCGSPMTVDFGEATNQHGVLILDIRDGGVLDEFVPLKDRRFITLDFHHEDPVGQIALSQSIGWDVEDAVVRVRYKATEEQARRIDAAALKKSLLDTGAHKVFQISAEIVKQDRARVQGFDENLEPESALGLWCDANEIDNRGGLHELLHRYSVTAP